MRTKLIVGSLVLGCAIAVSVMAAYMSVVGLAALFAGSTIAVILMGIVLETTKLMAAGWVHSNWRNPRVSRLHRGYLCGAVVALMIITNLGIFGFLMKAHLEQKAPAAQIELQIQPHQTKIDQLVQRRTELQTQQTAINKTVDGFLATGKAAGASRFMRQQQAERDRLSTEINSLDDQIAKENAAIAPLKQEALAVEAKLGPLKYIPGVKDPTTAVQVLICIVMLAFDPLAVVTMISGTITLHEYLDERRAREERVEHPEDDEKPKDEEQGKEPEEIEGLSWPEALEEVDAPTDSEHRAAKLMESESPVPIKSLPEVEMASEQWVSAWRAAPPTWGVFTIDAAGNGTHVAGATADQLVHHNPNLTAAAPTTAGATDFSKWPTGPGPIPVPPIAPNDTIEADTKTDMEAAIAEAEALVAKAAELVPSPKPNFGGTVDPDYRARLLSLETGEPSLQPVENELGDIDHKDLLVAILESDPVLLNDVIEAVKEAQNAPSEPTVEKKPTRKLLEPKNPRGSS